MQVKPIVDGNSPCTLKLSIEWINSDFVYKCSSMAQLLFYGGLKTVNWVLTAVPPPSCRARETSPWFAEIPYWVWDDMRFLLQSTTHHSFKKFDNDTPHAGDFRGIKFFIEGCPDI